MFFFRNKLNKATLTVAKGKLGKYYISVKFENVKILVTFSKKVVIKTFSKLTGMNQLLL